MGNTLTNEHRNLTLANTRWSLFEAHAHFLQPQRMTPSGFHPPGDTSIRPWANKCILQLICNMFSEIASPIRLASIHISKTVFLRQPPCCKCLPGLFHYVRVKCQSKHRTTNKEWCFRHCKMRILFNCLLPSCFCDPKVIKHSFRA